MISSSLLHYKARRNSMNQPSTPTSKAMKRWRGGAMIVVAVMTWMAAVGVGEGKALSCGSTFFSALVQLIPCRAAVAPFSPIPPSDACCNAIRTLGQPCLCALVNGSPISGVDRNMAMLLPDKCSATFDPCEIMKK